MASQRLNPQPESFRQRALVAENMSLFNISLHLLFFGLGLRLTKITAVYLKAQHPIQASQICIWVIGDASPGALERSQYADGATTYVHCLRQ